MAPVPAHAPPPLPPDAVRRPRTRGECVNGPRPCPWTCRYALLGGRCALDYAARGEITDAEIAPLLGVTRSRVQQLAQAALRKLREAGEAGDLDGLLDPDLLAMLLRDGEDEDEP